MSQYPYPWQSCWTSLDLNLYLSIGKKLKNVDVEYQIKVGYYASLLMVFSILFKFKIFYLLSFLIMVLFLPSAKDKMNYIFYNRLNIKVLSEPIHKPKMKEINDF